MTQLYSMLVPGAVRKIAIIGGGPSGVAAAKYLLAEKVFTEVTIYEQRSSSGGVWNYFPLLDTNPTIGIPNTRPDTRPEKPTWADGKAAFSSPLYDLLEANLPKQLMQHSDQAFAEEDQLFPTHEQITAYAERYAKELRNITKYSTQVTNLEYRRPEYSQKPQNRWRLTSLDLSTSTSTTHDYDAIIVASGHYTTPFIPDLPGIRDFAQHFPGVIVHSKFYRRPDEYKDKKVLVIGNGPSAIDIASQIQRVASALFISTRSEPRKFAPDPGHPSPTYLPAIKSFLKQDEDHTQPAVEFADGTIIEAIDAILLCTGYLYSYPFLPQLQPPVITTGQRANGVYKHIFYTYEPTLAFLGLPWNIVPFPISQGQGSIIARVWAGRLELPGVDQMEAWEREVEEEMGTGKEFHRLQTPKDAKYLNELAEWAAKAGGEEEVGKKPPFWNKRMLWMREMVPQFRNAFTAVGKERKDVRTVEELGFHFGDREGDDK